MLASSIVNHFLFRPPQTEGYHAKHRITHIQNKRGSRIATMYIRRRHANVTILFSHGNAEDLNSAYWWMRKLSQDLDVNVMGYDYTGYGSNTEDPSESKCYCDIDAAYDYLLNVRGLNPEQIVLYGRSLGSGPSCYLAARTSREGHPVGGLILHSAFASVYRVVVDVGITMPGDKFANVDRIREVRCPVCIVHGHMDTVISLEHAQMLTDAVNDKFRADSFFAEGMDHSYFGYDVEVLLMDVLNKYLDHHILTRRLWMKPARRYCSPKP